MKETKVWAQGEVVPGKEEPRKEVEDGVEGDNAPRTFPAEESLQYFQAGDSTNDACCSWSLLWQNPPSQLIDSSLYRNWIQQLESFFLTLMAMPSQLMAAPRVQWSEYWPQLTSLLFWQWRCYVSLQGGSFDILNINLQKGKLSVQTRRTYAATYVIEP